MAKNFKIAELRAEARYTVRMTDKHDKTTETQEMTGAELATFTNAAAHLYDIHAEEITTTKPKECKTMTNKNTVSISKGNTKMGYIPSVSLPPVITCAANCQCAKKCYAANLCRIYPSVKKAYARNLEILKNDMDNYFLQVKAAAMTSNYFRYHVSGDIPDMNYLDHMVKLAEELPGTTFLAFTKRYNFVNNFLQYAQIPGNLKIIFSAWPGMPMENPHNLPVAHVIFKGQEPADDWKICGGNCSECACRGVGCWELKTGEHIAFHEHK